MKTKLTDEEFIQNLAHDRFVHFMIRTNDRIFAYQEAYPNCTDSMSAYRGATRLLAMPTVNEDIKAGLMEAQRDAIEIRRTFYQNRIADDVEKRELLAKVMRGECANEKEVLDKAGNTVTLKTSNVREVLRAIEIDTQLENELFKHGSKYLK